ncbi:MAG: transposase [Natronospirillum sp.]|uniref:IS66-like element accessory protein TnpA n=1 Tax=Natronospirillum sp. TaxID=2812955 RepID=UPI0025E41ED6|nr:transposase [Natronospirillum sp.]MCH8551974.1 transposase [Natronospirillum sp.]
MSELSEHKPARRRRRFSDHFKARIVSRCAEPGASVSRIALDHQLNANMVRRWIREAEPGAGRQSPGFVALPSPTASHQPSATSGKTIRIEVPRPGGPVVVEWPVGHAHECLALLRELLP